MKSRLFLCLLLVPALCLAELTPYQQDVLTISPTADARQPLRDAYAAQSAGTATDAQQKIIRTSEMIYEDMKLAGCVRPVLGADVSFEAAIAKVVAAGQSANLIADGKAQFGTGEWEAGIPADTPPEQMAVAVAMLLASSSTPPENDPVGAMRALRRRMILDYYLAFATNGKCKASPQLKALLGKGGKQ